MKPVENTHVDEIFVTFTDGDLYVSNSSINDISDLRLHLSPEWVTFHTLGGGGNNDN